MNMETNWNYSRILLYRTGIIQTSTYIEVGLWSQLWATAKGGKTIGFIEHGYIKLLAISSNQRRPRRPQSSFISNVYWRSLPSVLWLCWLGDSKGIRPVKNWVVWCWRELLDTVKARKLAYYGHTMRKHRSCLEKEIMQGTMPGARRRGRPCTTWMDNIKTWTGLSVEESVRMRGKKR